MLKELALTPHLFDESSHENSETWIEQVRELGRRLFVENAACPFLVSDLLGGGWSGEVYQMIENADPGRRPMLLSLLSKLADILVFRHSGDHDLHAEGDWVREALFCCGRPAVAIDRIVATQAAAREFRQNEAKVRGLPETQKQGFWDELESNDTPQMIISEQIQRLRLLCLHAGFICLASPWIRGGRDDDSPFALALVRAAADRPEGHCIPVIDIHTDCRREDRETDQDYGGKVDNVRHNVSLCLQEANSPKVKIRLFIWHRLLDRHLLAGDSPGTRDERLEPRVRWGISLNHVARPQDPPQPPASWKLMKPKEAGMRRDYYYPREANCYVDGPVKIT